MLTREEFIDLQIAARRAEKDVADAFETGAGIPEALSVLVRARDNVLAAFDAMDARIVELETKLELRRC